MTTAHISNKVMKCNQRKLLYKIKTHTSNKKWAGTDANISMDIRIMERNLTATGNATEAKMISQCDHLDLDNDNPYLHERGYTNHFYAKKFGEIHYSLSNALIVNVYYSVLDNQGLRLKITGIIFVILGTCKLDLDDLAEGVYDSTKYYIEIVVYNSGGVVGSWWHVDLFKFYFMGIGDSKKIVACYPGEGDGKWVASGQFKIFK